MFNRKPNLYSVCDCVCTKLALVCDILMEILRNCGWGFRTLKKKLVHSIVKIPPWAFHLRGIFQKMRGIPPTPSSASSLCTCSESLCKCYMTKCHHFP